MSYSFNLVDNAWITCLTREGEYVEVSLFDLLTQAHRLEEIHGETPLVTAAIFPVALAVLHRVFGPKDEAEWRALWKQGAFDEARLEMYFRQWYERFELFGDGRRFYQERDSRFEKPKSMIHIVHAVANNATLFTHLTNEAGVTLTCGEAARQLVTGQYFHGGGLGGLPSAPFTDSILTRGVLFFAEGTTLFETFMLNLVRYPDTATMPSKPEDKPHWEMDEGVLPRRTPLGYLDYLTWQSSRFWLLPETTPQGEVVVRETLIAPSTKLDEKVFSPFKRYVSEDKKHEEFSFMCFSERKALWRDYHSLLTINSNAIKPPAVVRWLAELGVRMSLPPIRLMAIGMLADQAKQIFYRQERMNLPQTLLGVENSDRVNAIQLAIAKASKVETATRDAVKRLARELLQRGGDGDPDPAKVTSLLDQWNATSVYWAALEAPFWELVDRIARDDESASVWWQEDVLRPSAQGALLYAETLAGKDSAAFKGSVSAHRVLNFGLKKALNAVS